MRDVKFITCAPSDTYYTWQVHLWLESLREIGKSDKAIVLIYEPKARPYNKKWDQIIALYPESRIIFYREKPEEDINALIHIYIPIIREYLMWTFFTDHPEESQNAIFFCDSDILFNERFNIDDFVDDDVNYISDAVSYMGAVYFDNKYREVLPAKLKEYQSKDILQEILDCVGVTREVAMANQEHSGGVQYLLKNTNAAFWFKVMNDSIVLNLKMKELNTKYFPSQALGFQSWCADMWGILWNLWYQNKEVKVIPEMAFSWASDKIEILETKSIFHNAGIIGSFMETGPSSIKVLNDGSKLTLKQGYDAFYKGKYHLGSDPTKDPDLDKIIASEASQKYGTWYYAKKLKELSLKYKINY